jgi:chemotaxis protein CheX
MSAPSTTDSPRAAWPEILRQAATEAFSTMAGLTLMQPETSGIPVAAHVTGMVGIAGALSATFSLRCSLDCATKIASQMLGVSLEEAAAQKCDAVGEICNIVAGSLKAKIGLGDQCMLSVPTVLAGLDYQIRRSSVDVRLEFPLLCQQEAIWIALDIRP